MKGALMRTCVLCQLGLEVTDALPILGRKAHTRCVVALQTRTNVAAAAMGKALVFVGKRGRWTNPANDNSKEIRR